MYCSTEDTSLRDFYIMTLYRTYGHVSENTKLMLLPCGQRTMLQELRIVKEELTLILVNHVISTGHQISKLVLNIMILLTFSCNCSKLRKQNSYLSKIQTLANYHFFISFEGSKKITTNIQCQFRYLMTHQNDMIHT